MAISDPVADMFTRIRNALLVEHDSVLIPFSKMKLSIAKILKAEGFIKYYEVIEKDAKSSIKIGLKYTDSGQCIIGKIQRVSRPGKRIYISKDQIPKVRNGFGICIVSTPKGMLSGRDARLNNTGGELVGVVY